ncbi:hypothetical protein T05_477 [Trichinella murrelli]|uniref:Uncharacterized protein n=1 Tax=Trichinella murrelli TaxID=144512 RepID=A0A0V0UEY6_9BILA|nr:hypothetical protein T05_477 [Trichinella murrelli]
MCTYPSSTVSVTAYAFLVMQYEVTLTFTNCNKGKHMRRSSYLKIVSKIVFPTFNRKNYLAQDVQLPVIKVQN